MGNIASLTETIGRMSASLNEFISDNRTILGIAGAGAAGVALGAAGGYLAGKKSSSKKRTSKSRNKRKRNSRGRSRDRKFISKQKHEQSYARRHPKRRKTGRVYKHSRNTRNKRVKYTKNGQPYIILKSGKARFIKK